MCLSNGKKPMSLPFINGRGSVVILVITGQFTVSLTSQVGKVFERIIRDSLVKFLEENELLRNSQHGFRTKRSCLTNLLEFLDPVSDCVD